MINVGNNISWRMNFDRKCVIIDNGTGFTKMGYAGNTDPSFDIPTLITDAGQTGTDQNKFRYDLQHLGKTALALSNRTTTETLDFSIGEQARGLYKTHRVVNPIECGVVLNWDLMEKFWHRSLFDYLRCDPAQTVVVLTEPPYNPPQNRESVAEIMFETFNVKGLYLGVQAVFALISATGVNNKVEYTGTVLDSGDGVTHIIPIVDGFVISSCIKHVPLAGSNITAFIASMLKDRNEKCPIEEVARIARTIKQKYCYVSEKGNLLQQLSLFDRRMNNQELKNKYHKVIQGFDSVSKAPYSVTVGPQIFMAPQMFFHPEIIDERYRQSVDEMLDKVIQMCPIDTRRKLYSNIALSGGSTLFRGFRERIQRNMNERIKSRLQRYETISNLKSTPITVKVLQNPYQRYAVWQGASIFACQSGFENVYHTKAQYQEFGPSICRHNAVYPV